MVEYLVIGFLLGFVVTSILCKWLFHHEIEYKAKTGIDMCLRGKFYTITRNRGREQNE